jgi:hypothetical protein
MNAKSQDQKLAKTNGGVYGTRDTGFKLRWNTSGTPPVNCNDYRSFLNDPARIDDCERKIELMRHVSVCPNCLKLALSLIRTELSHIALDEPINP